MFMGTPEINAAVIKCGHRPLYLCSMQ